MDPDSAEVPVASKRPSAARVVAAFLLVMLLLLLSVAYHDALFWTDAVGDSDEENLYRFRGVVETYDAESGEIVFRDHSGTASLRWNVTTPRAPAWYVVDAERSADGELVALALTPVLIFRG